MYQVFIVNRDVVVNSGRLDRGAKIGTGPGSNMVRAISRRVGESHANVIDRSGDVARVVEDVGIIRCAWHSIRARAERAGAWSAGQFVGAYAAHAWILKVLRHG